VQGALLTGQTAYDPPVGPPDLSLLAVLADLGFAAVTFAIRGYGASTVPEDPLAISTEDAMEDLAAVIAWTLAETGLSRVSLLGWSWGGRVVGRFVETHPELVDRVVLMDPALGGNKPTPERTPTSPWKQLTAEEYRNRLEPDFTDPEIVESVARYAAATDTRAPMGVARESTLGPVPVRPELVVRPTLMIYGEAAARADYMQGAETREAFFGRLGTDDRSFVVVPEAGDYMQFQRGRLRLHEHLATFLAPAVGGAG
jgi:pimeloyl-ACP methyl ester carboxylesterase